MRTLKYLGAAAAVLLLAALALSWLLLRASLPRLDGALAASGLTGAVRITRDSRGVPTIEDTDGADLAYASGFVHAQDRYFQMDLSRRLAAGELAELFGGVALEQDRRARLFRFRTVAREVLAQAAPAERALLEAYARGVNAGVADLAGGRVRERPARAGGGQQQLGGRGPPDRDRRRARRQRHAPRAAGAAAVVSRPPADRLRRTGPRPERRHAARSAAAGLRVERTHRLGLHQQLRHLAGCQPRAVHRGGAARADDALGPGGAVGGARGDPSAR